MPNYTENGDNRVNPKSYKKLKFRTPILNRILNPNIEPNIGPDSEPNIEPNIEPKIECNIACNIGSKFFFIKHFLT